MTSTVLSLLVVPVVFDLVDEVKQRLARLHARTAPDAGAEKLGA